MSKPELPDPLDALGALYVAVVAWLVATMLIDLVAYGMEKLT